ncbi:MAG: putative Ig domain-containing protein [Anaerovoracaceae bacterium]
MDIIQCPRITDINVDSDYRKLNAVSVSETPVGNTLWYSKLGSTLEQLTLVDTETTDLSLGSNTALKHLRCSENRLQTLNVKGNKNLETLNCSNNLLEKLDLSQNTNLLKLECAGNRIPNLDLSKNTKLTTAGVGYAHNPLSVGYSSKTLQQKLGIQAKYNRKTKRMEVNKSDLENAGIRTVNVDPEDSSVSGPGAAREGFTYSFDSPMQYDGGWWMYSIKVQVNTKDPVNMKMPVTLAVTPKEEIITENLPSGKVQTDYDAFLERSNDAVIDVVISNGNLPDGLMTTQDYLNWPYGSINIYGTPEKDGRYTFKVQSTSRVGSDEKQYTLVIGPKIKETQSWGSPKVGSAYDYQVQKEKGVSNGTWSKTAGSLPNGLSFDTGAGRLHGTPDQDGKYEFTLKFKNDYGEDVISKKDFTVAPAVKEADLATARMGTGYAATLNTRGKCTEDDSAKWSLADGKLPDGLTLNAKSGKISGSPQKPGTYNFSAKFTNKYGSDTKQFSITVKASIKTDSSLPAAKLGKEYSETLEMPEGTDPGTWSVAQGNLPEGLKIDAGSGKISGYPKSEGTYKFKASYTTDKEEYSKIFTIKVGPAISTDVLPNAKKDSAYSASLATYPGTTHGTWSVSGKLPEGLALNAETGKITGTPEKTGTYSFMATFQNKYGKDSKMLNINVTEVDTVVTALPDGKKGSVYSVVLAPPVSKKGNWKVSDGSLPDGLTLDYLTGTISGIPSKEGDYSFTAKFTTIDGATEYKYTIKILGADALEIATDQVLPEGTLGSDYSAELRMKDGTAAGTWSLENGKLPKGLSLNKDTGVISGVPEQDGLFEIEATFTNAAGTATGKFMIKVMPAIKTDALPGVKVGEQYSKTLETCTGASEGIWYIDGNLPAGLSLDQKTGKISGIPTKAGVYDFIARFANENGTCSKLLEIKVWESSGIAAMKNGKVGSPYEAYPASSIGSGTWSVETGSLPDGLDIDKSTGRIHGTPTVEGHYEFTLKCTETGGAFSRDRYSIDILAKDGLSILTDQILPNGLVKSDYDFQMEASESTGITWSIVSGKLPEGLTLNLDGSITGRPTAAGTYPFELKCTSGSESAVKKFVITVDPVSVSIISKEDLPVGYVGKDYSKTLEADASEPGTWTVTKGVLPEGLSLDKDTGVISGKPQKIGKETFTVEFKNDDGTDEKEFTLAVKAVISTESALPDAKIGEQYSETLDKPEGTEPGKWSVSGGTLPDGLTINPGSGKISGYPESEGTYTFRATYSTDGEAVSKTFRIKVGPAISTDVLPDAKKGRAYSAALEVRPGTTNGTWSVSGNVPEGLKLNNKTGKISGVPAKADQYSFMVTFRNKYGEDSRVLDINVLKDEVIVKALPNGRTGKEYATMLAAPSAEKGSWEMSEGSLPEGLTLDQTSGLISGTPTKAGESKFTVTFTDGKETYKFIYTIKILDAAAPEISIVTDSALHKGKLGSAYDAELKVSEETGAGKWSVLKGKLPAGLSLGGDGRISGTPQEDGTFEFKAEFRTGSASASRTFIMKVEPQIKTGVLPGAVSGEKYTKILETYEGAAKGVWYVEGTLPEGLTLDSKTGTISGTPTQEGIYDFIARFANRNGSDSRLFEIVVDKSTLKMNFRDGKVGRAYEYYLAGSGAWSQEEGTLPEGLALDNATGKIYGTPVKEGSYSFRLKNDGHTFDCSMKILAKDALSITTNDVLPRGIVDGKYEVLLEASQSEGLIWKVDSGELPAGLVLGENGKISGMPQKAGTSCFTVKCISEEGDSAVKEFAITVDPAEITIDPVLPGGDTGEDYNIDISVDDNSNKPGKWTVTDGELPPGMHLDQNTGEITGTPTKPGDYDFSITYTNEHGTVTKDFHFHVEPNIAIDNGSTDIGDGENVDISFTLPDGTKPGEWTVTDGSLPPGVTVDKKDGHITGTPDKPGTYTFTITFKNEDGVTITKEVTLVVKGGPESAEKAVSEKLMKTGDKKDPKGSSFSKIRLTNGKVKSSSIALKWNKVRGAKKYVVYGSKCGTKNPYKVLVRQKSTKLTVKTLAGGAALSKGKYHKFFVAAFDKNGKLLAVSKSAHVTTTGGKYTNFKSVKVKNVKRSSKTLKKGKKFKFRTKALKVSKKRKVQSHRKLAFESSNKKIATVSKSGVVKAKKKGTCYIYAYLQSGNYAKVKVRVK